MPCEGKRPGVSDHDSDTDAASGPHTGEQAAIDRVDEPVTVASLVADLRDLGVDAGDTVLVHSSMSELGWVSGGPPAVVDALHEAVGADGTIVVPTFTGQYTDPATWEAPPVPDDWVERIRETRPPYRPAITPSRGVGAVPECLRTYPDAIRSRHPELSFAAIGPASDRIVGEHEFDDGLGEGSPLARLYDRDATVLLLGVGYGVTSSFHLAEYRATIDLGRVERAAPIVRDGERVVVEYVDRETTDEDFETIGAAFERRRPGAVTTGSVGAATARLASQPALVDIAVDWMETNRSMVDG